MYMDTHVESKYWSLARVELKHVWKGVFHKFACCDTVGSAKGWNCIYFLYNEEYLTHFCCV